MVITMCCACPIEFAWTWATGYLDLAGRLLDNSQVGRNKVSIVANVCAADTAIIAFTIPSWLRVFGDELVEILLVVDEQPPSGRMAAHHKQMYTNRELCAAVEQLRTLSSKVRSVILDYGQARDISLKWFGELGVVRCQSGSPIFGYAYAIERASSDIVLRLDCDMLFFDAGWIETAINLLALEKLDLVEPPKLGMNIHGYHTTISTRAFMVKRSNFLSRCLPLRPHQLDWARRFHRALNGRPTWLSLEEILKKEKENGRIRHSLLDSSLGFSVHVWTREYADLEEFGLIISAIESGSIPPEQVSQGWNLVLESWPTLKTPSHSLERAF